MKTHAWRSNNFLHWRFLAFAFLATEFRSLTSLNTLPFIAFKGNFCESHVRLLTQNENSEKVFAYPRLIARAVSHEENQPLFHFCKKKKKNGAKL